jgi:hypothetical protein
MALKQETGEERAMTSSTPDAPDRGQGRREKPTIDRLDDRGPVPENQENHQVPSTTDSGASVEEQVRKEWDPKKGGLPVF